MVSQAYLASHFVVMQVHERPGVLLYLPCVHKHLGEAQAVVDVGRAAAPFPALLLAVQALFVLVAAAAAQAALRAGGGHGVSDPGGDDSVGERGLLAACEREKKKHL